MALFRRRSGDDSRGSGDAAEVYRGLRDQALDLANTDLEGAPAADPRALVMDAGTGDATYTLLAVADGTLSLYFSNGGGMIGAGNYPNPGQAATTVVAESAAFRPLLEPGADPTLPGPGRVRISIVRSGSISTGEFDERELGENRSPLSPLFHRAHHLIAIVRRVEEARTNEPPLVFAIMMGDCNEVRRLLSEGADVGTSSTDGDPAIGVAAAAGDAAIVGELLSAGADPTTRVRTPGPKATMAPLLCVAAGRGDVDTIGVLVSGGAPIDGQDDSGLGALHVASFTGQAAAVDALVGHGASLELREEDGYTPLMMAANAGQTDCVRLLLERGADPSAVDAANCTPIMFAAQHGHVDAVRLLLDRGADPTFVSDHGLSAIDFAARNARIDVLQLLRPPDEPGP